MKSTLALLSLIALTSCMPYSANAPLPAESTPDRAFSCAARTLSSMGYMILESDEHYGTIRAERPLHFANPFPSHRGFGGGTGAFSSSTADTIWVAVSEERKTHQPKIYVTGNTFSRQDGGFRTGPPIGSYRSREVVADSQNILTNCGVWKGSEDGGGGQGDRSR